MNVGERAFLEIVEMSHANNQEAAGDYYDEAGLLMCGKCYTPKQRRVKGPKSLGDQLILVGQRCRCAEEKYQADKKAEKHEEFLHDLKYRCDTGPVDIPQKDCRIENADAGNVNALIAAKDYIEKWDKMREQGKNIGIMFYGAVGTGKTYLAQCIANALIEKDIMAGVTSFPKILAYLQTASDDERRSAIRGLGWFELLIIDDFGTERDTSYSTEQIFSVVDARLRSGKPVIFTTNLSPETLFNPKDMAYRRIYDRIGEMCSIQIRMDGESRRQTKTKELREAALRIFGYGRVQK